MKKLGLSFIAVVVVTGLSFAGGKSMRHTGFSGVIMDSQCAAMGTHDPAGYKMTSTSTPKDCTLACAKMGGKFVLYNATKKATYQLDDQDKARDFAGQNVKVSGTYDRATKTIHVTNIEAAS